MLDEGTKVMKEELSETGPIKVMIIEDEEAHFQLMKRAICKELPKASVFHTLSAAACLEELDSINPDILLVDYLLPDMTGIEFLSAIKHMACDIPVIMITGQGDEGIAVKAMKLGAQDYLVKNADFFLLLPAVIEQVIRERRLNRNLHRLSRLNESLLESLPYPAMMIRKDQVVLAANRMAHEMGTQVGEYCRQIFRFDQLSGQRKKAEGECSFCRRNEMFQLNKAINIPDITVNGRIYDIWWIPMNHEIFLHYAIDVTDRKMAEYKLLASSRFLEITNRHIDTKPLLHEFVHDLKSIIGCCIVAAWVINSEGNTPLIVSEGYDPRLLEPAVMFRMNMDASPGLEPPQNGSESLILSPESMFFAGTDVTQANRFLSTALLPVRLKEKTFGSIFLADTREGILPLEIIEIAATAAMKLAIAVERIQSRELLKKSEQTLHFLSDRLMTAQEEERKKISHELHDSIGSSLCAIHLSLSIALQDNLKREPLEKILSLTKNTIDEVRRIMSDLRPSFLDELGIIATLAHFCKQFEEIHPGINVKQQVKVKEDEVPDPLKIVMLRIVQESFNNIAKYSRATTVRLNLIKKEGAIRLSVDDNGIGFNPDSIGYRKELGTGIGLVSMKERAELSGGSFILNSKKGEGTTITASWPF
jgi:signal transduction histidine kinase/DNA-binding NarL/FixJ family response regulator